MATVVGKGSQRLTATLQLTVGGVPNAIVDAAADEIMTELLKQPGVIDPVVSSDPDSGQMLVSFEFEATGDVREDVTRALGMFQDALRREPQERFNWQRWLEGLDLERAGTVQYPLVGVA
jgi:hypothetical protein